MRLVIPRIPPRRPSYFAASIFVALLLSAGCSLGRPAATPEPTALPARAPGLAASTEEPRPVRTPDATPRATDTPVATGIGLEVAGVTVYRGEIVPEEQVVVVAETSGRILALDLEVGQRVAAGDILARLDSSMLEAQRAQALATLEAAQAQVELLKVEADETEIEAARAVVAAAETAYTRALDGPTTEDLSVAATKLRQAEADVARAQAAYDQVAWNPLITALPEARDLELATLAREAAQAQYDQLMQGPSEDVVAAAYAQVASARAQLRRLEDGAEPAQIAAAEAQVRQAETALYLAQLQLDKTAVRAPINGIVARVDLAAGAMATPGASLALLLTPAVKIETPVEEAHMAQLQIGQEARIRVNAYPDRIIQGVVAIIAPRLDANSRTVLVTVRPVGDDSGLTSGMFATVEFVTRTATLP